MTQRVQLAAFCQARSGEKADVSNIAVFAPTDATYQILLEQVTVERVRKHFANFVKGDVRRYEVPNVRAVNFVMQQALGGGGLRTLQTDMLAKTYAPNLLRMEVDVDSDLLTDVMSLLPPRSLSGA